MTIALVGNDIPSLLPGFLADHFYALKAPGAFRVFEQNPALLDLLQSYGEKVLAHSGVPGKLTVFSELSDALCGADAVIFAQSGHNASRFQMDLHALCGESDDDPGLQNQARVHDGIGGLMFSLRAGEKVLQLARAMRQSCPHALVLNLTQPLNQTTALFHLEGFDCLGFGQDAMRGPKGVEGLCHALNKKPSTLHIQTAGLYLFEWLIGLSEKATGKSLMEQALQAAQKGALGEDSALFAAWYDAVPVGMGHGEFLPENTAYQPEIDPVFSEPIEKRKQRMLYMNTVAQKGLDEPEGELAQLGLLKSVSPLRPVKCLLEGEAYPSPVLRKNGGTLKNLPDNAVIFAPRRSPALSLPEGVADIVSEVAYHHLLCARAAKADREALRAYIDTAPALQGLDRLYLHSLVEKMLALNADVLLGFALNT